MKLVSFVKNEKPCAGLVCESKVFDIQLLKPELPGTMLEILDQWNQFYPLLRAASEKLLSFPEIRNRGIPLTEVILQAPIPHPPSLRDGYAFRQHVETARRNRGLEMTPVFDSFPVFYFGNHLTVRGPGPVYVMPDHCKKLDFELEAAIVISRRGKTSLRRMPMTTLQGS